MERRKIKKVIAVTGRRETDLPQEMSYQAMLDQFNAHTKEVVEVTVNGKIKDLTNSFNEYVKVDTEWKETDKNWKKRAEPWIKVAENSSWSFKIFILFLKTTGLLGAAILAYLNIKKLLK